MQGSGFDGVEIIIDNRWDTRQAPYIKALAAQSGIHVHSIHAPFQTISEMGADYPSTLKATIKLAEEVGARTVVIHPISRGTPDLAQWLQENLAGLQAQTPVLLTVENLPRKLVKRLGIIQRDFHEFWHPSAMSPFPAQTMDTTHYGVSKVDILDAWRQLRGAVRHIHLSDEYNGREHLFPGEGTLPLGDFVSELGKSNFAGIVVVELHPYALHAGRSDEKVRDRIFQAARFCRQHLAAARTATEPAVSPSR
jgi:sugar phosphate isomerase/epimerase